MLMHSKVSLNIHDSFFHTKNCSDSEIDCFADGLLMELPSASSASSKYTKMASTVTLVLTLKVATSDFELILEQSIGYFAHMCYFCGII